MAPLTERIQKALANAGIGSRRAIERWVAEGRVTVDGRVAKLGEQLKGKERICLDGRPVRYAPTRARSEPSFLAYYKAGSSRTSNEHREDRALLSLPRPPAGRWIDVSPLDPNTSGLVVLTTDGELASRLMHPSTVIEREYAVRLLGAPSVQQTQQLLDGVELDDGTAKVAAIEGGGGSGSNAWYHMVLREARHRDLRPALASVGLAVSRIIRIRYGTVELGKLYRGATRPLTTGERQFLYDAAGSIRRKKTAVR